jgi:hypothetical protein
LTFALLACAGVFSSHLDPRHGKVGVGGVLRQVSLVSWHHQSCRTTEEKIVNL